jgi:CspA family cold shock protein
MIRAFFSKIFNTGSSKGSRSKGNKEGKVKFFNRSKGFGFITVKDSGEEVFVHKTGLIDKIRQNDKVTFNLEKSEKGLTAVKVRVI